MTVSGMEIIERLRKEDFNIDTEHKLAHHKYIVAAEAGALTLVQRRAFVYEQYAIQRSDAISFAMLAGHVHFKPPKSLSHAKLPEGNNQDLFHFLLGGELYASSLLLDHAKSLGIDNESDLSSSSYHKYSSLAQAYPSYWARLAIQGASGGSASGDGNDHNHNNIYRAAGAAACAVNFPAWGRMCQRLYQIESTEFLKFFATPIPHLDEMAAAIIDDNHQDNNNNNDADADENYYEELAQHVRLLQEYEVWFWDGIFDATE